MNSNRPDVSVVESQTGSVPASFFSNSNFGLFCWYILREEVSSSRPAPLTLSFKHPWTLPRFPWSTWTVPASSLFLAHLTWAWDPSDAHGTRPPLSLLLLLPLPSTLRNQHFKHNLLKLFYCLNLVSNKSCPHLQQLRWLHSSGLWSI